MKTLTEKESKRVDELAQAVAGRLHCEGMRIETFSVEDGLPLLNNVVCPELCKRILSNFPEQVRAHLA